LVAKESAKRATALTKAQNSQIARFCKALPAGVCTQNTFSDIVYVNWNGDGVVSANRRHILCHVMCTALLLRAAWQLLRLHWCLLQFHVGIRVWNAKNLLSDAFHCFVGAFTNFCHDHADIMQSEMAPIEVIYLPNAFPASEPGVPAPEPLPDAVEAGRGSTPELVSRGSTPELVREPAPDAIEAGPDSRGSTPELVCEPAPDAVEAGPEPVPEPALRCESALPSLLLRLLVMPSLRNS
jgi:hypothetical protein